MKKELHVSEQNYSCVFIVELDGFNGLFFRYSARINA